MNIVLGTAYERLRTRFVRFTPVEPVGRSVVTHDHEIDEDGDLVAYLPDDDTNLVFMCGADVQAEVCEDHLLVRNGDGLLFKIQFLEMRPQKRLRARILL